MQTTCTSNPVAVVMVYATCPDLDVARRIGRAVVEEGLAACANCIPGMTSIYRWEGAMQESAEVVLLLKATMTQAQGLQQRLATLHPYATPCIIELPVSSAHPGFAAWVAAMTGGGDQRP